MMLTYDVEVQTVQKAFGKQSQVFYFDATIERHFQ